MRLTCPSCRSDFIIPEEELVPSDRVSGCPFCSTEYRVETGPDGKPHPKFNVHTLKKKRVCIDCNKEFETGGGEVIPVCPACRASRDGDRLEIQGWKLVKANRVIELESEQTVREWIRQGAIGPEDRLIAPDRRDHFAKRFERFEEEFRAQRQRQKTVTRAGALSRRFPMGTFLRWTILLAAAGLAGWTLFRFLTFRPSGPLFDRNLDVFVQRLAPRAPASGRSETELVGQALSLMARDISSGYEDAARLLEQAVVTDRTSAAGLGALAETYALAYGAGDDPKARVSAAELAGLAVKLFPEAVDGYVARVRSALGADDLQTPRADLEKAFALDPRAPRLLLARAAFLLASAKGGLPSEELFQASRAALSLKPDLAEAYDLMAQAYLRQGDPVSAREQFDRRLKLSANDARAMSRMGLLELRSLNPRNAREWFEQALKASPSEVPARLQLAVLLSRDAESLPAAERHLREILGRFRRFAAAPDIFRAQVALARILVDTQRVSEAAELLQQIPAAFLSSPEAALEKAAVLRVSQKNGAAVTLLREAVTAHPENDRLLFELGRALVAQGETDEALKQYRESARRNPAWFAPYAWAVLLLSARDRGPEALEFATTAVSRPLFLSEREFFADPLVPSADPDFKSLLAAADRFIKQVPDQAASHAFRGLCLLRKGIEARDPDALARAARDFTAAASLNRNSEIFPALAGRANLEGGNVKAALSVFDIARKINPTNTTVRLWRADALRAAGRRDEARQELSAILTDPEWGAFALNAMGDLLAARNLAAEAQEHWRAALRTAPLYTAPFKSLLTSRE